MSAFINKEIHGFATLSSLVPILRPPRPYDLQDTNPVWVSSFTKGAILEYLTELKVENIAGSQK